jgi:hypothetical protein
MAATAKVRLARAVISPSPVVLQAKYGRRDPLPGAMVGTAQAVPMGFATPTRYRHFQPAG